MPRLSIFSMGCLLAAGLSAFGVKAAQDFPTRSVTIVAAGAPGLPVDIISRTLSPGTSGARRSPQFPDVPTFAELGLPNVPGLGYSVNAPAGTPREVLAKLYNAVAFALGQPDVKARLAQMQLDVSPTSAEVANRDLLAQGKLFSDVAARVGYVA